MDLFLRFFIGLLLAIHVVGLFFVLPDDAKRLEARAFFESVLPLSRAPSVAPIPVPDDAKPRIPLLITHPFANDQFTFQQDQRLRLESNKTADWFVDYLFVGQGKIVFWPTSPGQHFIQAKTAEDHRSVYVFIE